MLDEKVGYDRIPYFFSDQYEVAMEYSGYATEWDEVALPAIATAASSSPSALLNVRVTRFIRSRRVVDVSALTDPRTPLEPLAGELTTGS
jgi:3-phenylpropionate/trans-cinnamate dioxygenase ferredoxin reductase component